MAMARLEHANITVGDPQATATMLLELFGWKIRWEGEAMAGEGYTIHVGDDDTYLAVYSGSGTLGSKERSYDVRGGLNHLGVVVDDLDAVEAKVTAMGYETTNHADYEPGRRFYFYDTDGIELEIVSYD